jgi:2-octaprenyl-6-methoxyphenol hydroxylase
MRETCDILISGGGIAGMTAAAAFGSVGLRVICVDPAPPVTERDAEGSDLRTTAILQPARDLMERVGLWERLEPHAMALNTMRIVDAGGAEPKPRVIRDFQASDISDKPFGWNLPNWLLRREMAAMLNAMEQVDFRPGTATNRLFTRMSEARVGLSDGTSVTARLVIAADGRNSPMRQAAGIGVTTHRYGQKALAFAVTHTLPHDNVSTEIHRSGGPFTLVPLPDYEGRPSSAVVWMETGPNAIRLAALEPDAFETELNARACGVLGELRLASRRTVWPIISQKADALTGERLALMAEAAHVVPPIGAQGLNMSLADLRCLLELAEADPAGLGDAPMLEIYARKRHRDIALRVQGIDILNRASMAGAQPLRDIRAMGLSTLYALPAVRHTLMRMGLDLS